MDLTAEPTEMAASAEQRTGAVGETAPATVPGDAARESDAGGAAVARPRAAGGSAPPAAAGHQTPRFRLVKVVSVTVELPDQFPTILIEDAEGRPRQLSFRIGMAEGAAIAAALAGRTPPRPLTHDLFAQALERFSIDVLAVRLTGRVGTTYLADLDLTGPHGREVLACRPSDGICLALRRRVAAPVLADERLFTQAGDVAPEVRAGLAGPVQAAPAPAGPVSGAPAPEEA